MVAGAPGGVQGIERLPELRSHHTHVGVPLGEEQDETHRARAQEHTAVVRLEEGGGHHPAVELARSQLELAPERGGEGGERIDLNVRGER